MPYYQQLAGQIVSTRAEAKSDQSPVSGIAATITLTIAGTSSKHPAYESNEQPGLYSVKLDTTEVNAESLAIAWTTTDTDSNLVPTGDTLTLIDPSTLIESVQYCTIADVYRYFGSDNVNKWADKNNSKTQTRSPKR